MGRSKFPITREDKEMVELVGITGHKALAIWAIDCAMRVLPYFEETYAEDHRPRNALETLQTWIHTGVFRMDIVRKASLDSHAAAREVGGDNAARSVAVRAVKRWQPHMSPRMLLALHCTPNRPFIEPPSSLRLMLPSPKNETGNTSTY